jgi:hypothetical protein
MHLNIAANNGATLVSEAAAERQAAELRAGDPDWTYRVEVYESGFARVAIYDEDDAFVAYA